MSASHFPSAATSENGVPMTTPPIPFERRSEDAIAAQYATTLIGPEVHRRFYFQELSARTKSEVASAATSLLQQKLTEIGRGDIASEFSIWVCLPDIGKDGHGLVARGRLDMHLRDDRRAEYQRLKEERDASERDRELKERDRELFAATEAWRNWECDLDGRPTEEQSFVAGYRAGREATQ